MDATTGTYGSFQVEDLVAAWNSWIYSLLFTHITFLSQ